MGKHLCTWTILRNETAHEVLTSFESFKKFAAGIGGKRAGGGPKLELLTLVASTEDF